MQSQQGTFYGFMENPEYGSAFIAWTDMVEGVVPAKVGQIWVQITLVLSSEVQCSLYAKDEELVMFRTKFAARPSSSSTAIRSTSGEPFWYVDYV